MTMNVVMPKAMSPYAVGKIEAALPVLRMWEHTDAEIDAKASGIRALAAAAHLKVDGPMMSRFPNLELVAYFGVGYDTVDVAWAAGHGIVVTHTPDVLNEEVADTTLGLILNTVRQFSAAERYLRAGKWLEKPFPLSNSLRDRTVGILGLGRIGTAIARRCDAFGIPVVYHGRAPKAGVPYLYYPTLLGMAEACDILVVMAPGGPETRNLVDAEVLRALGPNGILINMARGSLVDETALIEALRDGTIAGAGLDVFVDEPRVPAELIAMENVVLLPHVGSASRYTRTAMDQVVVDNLVSWAAGNGPVTPVPETPWRGSKTPE